MVDRKQVRDSITVAAYRLAMPLAGRVPPHLAYPMLDRLADLIRLSAPGARAAVGDNLEQVLGSRGRRHARALRGVFRHNLRNYYDTFRLPSMSDDDVRDFVVLAGMEHLRAALERGRGAILVSAHASSLLAGAQAVTLAERGGVVAVEPVEPPEVLDLMLRVRQGHGLTASPVGPSLAVELAATLARNELAFLVTDRDVTGTGTPIVFFGRTTRLPTGPALLSIRTGAPILPAYVSRRRDGRLDGVLGAPLDVPRTGDVRADAGEISRRVTRCLEYHIARHPEQWTVLQRVWDGDHPRAARH
jgi:KDO2-lipid IV(A) lauroyltransferase